MFLKVMLTKNLDVQKGFVNGARGIVVGFQKDNDGKYLLFTQRITVKSIF